MTGSTKTRLALSLLVLGGIGALGVGMGRMTARPTAVAVVNLQRIQQGLAEWAEKNEQRQAKSQAFEAELKPLATQVDTLTADLKELKPGSEEYGSKLLQLRDLQGQLEGRYSAYQEIIDRDIAQFLRTMYLRIVATTEEIAGEGGWDLVLVDDRSIQPPENAVEKDVKAAINSRKVLFAVDDIGADVTDLVIEKMNAEYKASQR